MLAPDGESGRVGVPGGADERRVDVQRLELVQHIETARRDRFALERAAEQDDSRVLLLEHDLDPDVRRGRGNDQVAVRELARQHHRGRSGIEVHADVRFDEGRRFCRDFLLQVAVALLPFAVHAYAHFVARRHDARAAFRADQEPPLLQKLQVAADRHFRPVGKLLGELGQRHVALAFNIAFDGFLSFFHRGFLCVVERCFPEFMVYSVSLFLLWQMDNVVLRRSMRKRGLRSLIVEKISYYCITKNL